MDSISPYSRPDGCSDYDAQATAARQAVETRVLELFRLYGYEQITLPTLEYADLYNPQTLGGDLFYRLLSADISESALFPSATLDRAGDEVPQQGDRLSEVVLRPELTAPAARWFVNRWMARGEAEPLPARLAYAGQIFRDVDPSLANFKESRQIGVELIGGDQRWGDLEVLCLACEAAEKLKLPGWHLHLSHALLYQRILSKVGVPDEMLAQVASQVEIAARIAREVEAHDEVLLNYVRGFLETHASRVPEDHRAEDPGRLGADYWRDKLPAWNESFLRELWKRPKLHLPPKTVAKVLDLARLHGEADDFFSGLDRLVQDDEVTRLADELRWLCEELRREQGVTPLLTPASRGLAYYTGLTFEVHCPMDDSPETNVCGGGRYDGLPGWIYRRTLETMELRGERAEPAGDVELLNGVGLAFGLERLMAALAGAETEPAPGARVLVTALDRDLTAEAVRFSARLRRRGVATRCHLPPPSGPVDGIDAALAHAGRLAARFTVFFEPDEWRQGQVGLFDMTSRQQETRTPDAAVDHVTTALAERSTP